MYLFFDMLGGSSFEREVLADYRGEVTWNINASVVTVFAVIFIIALALAIIGIVRMRKQRLNKLMFALTYSA